MRPYDEEQEKRWTSDLQAMTTDVQCECCRSEMILTGGVVGACPEYPNCPQGFYEEQALRERKSR